MLLESLNIPLKYSVIDNILNFHEFATELYIQKS